MYFGHFWRGILVRNSSREEWISGRLLRINDRRRQKKILSDPVFLSARDFFQKRTSEEPLVREELEELKISVRETSRTTECDRRYRYTTSKRMWVLRTDIMR